MLCIFDWKNQGSANRCCVNVRIFGQLLCSHSTIHSLLNCLRIRRKRENHSSDRLELDLTFGKTLKESSLNDERMQELNLISSILGVCCSKFLFNYRLQHGTLFQVHKLCHIFCFFTCYVLSIGNWQCPNRHFFQIWTALWPRIHMYKWLRATGTGGETQTGSCVGVRLSVAPCLSEGKHPTWFP